MQTLPDGQHLFTREELLAQPIIYTGRGYMLTEVEWLILRSNNYVSIFPSAVLGAAVSLGLSIVAQNIAHSEIKIEDHYEFVGSLVLLFLSWIAAKLADRRKKQVIRQITEFFDKGSIT